MDENKTLESASDEYLRSMAAADILLSAHTNSLEKEQLLLETAYRVCSALVDRFYDRNPGLLKRRDEVFKNSFEHFSDKNV